MLKNLLKKEKGFTLIEIVLVLAIAGLILVIVFLAVGGAQRSRRDAQRKSDASRILAAYESCASNNDGNYPASTVSASACGTPAGDYFTGNDPNGPVYTQVNGTPTVGQYDYEQNRNCAGGSPGVRIVRVRIFQEAGGVFCVDNE